MRRIEFRLLGPPSILADGSPLQIARRKSAALLYRLCLAAEGIGRSQAAGLLWPEFPPDKARGNLRRTLADIGGIAEAAGDGRAPLIAVERTRLSLSRELAAEVDVLSFLSLAERGLADPMAPGAERCLSAAATLYRGEFLEGFYLDDAFEFEEWQLGEARRLAARASEVLEALARIALAREDPDAAAERARRIIEVDCAAEAAKRILAEVEKRRGAGPSIAPNRTSLPIPLTSLIGRRRELAEVAGFLFSRRLLTITGPGGVGKTRLALEAAREAALSFRLGATFVDLAPASDLRGVLAATYSALGVRGKGSERSAELLAAAIGLTERLLVLDNCEGVLHGSARLADALLSRCPGIVVLATSREALGLPGEQEYPLDPLPLRARARETGIEQGADAEALFARCAAEARPGFELGPDNEDDVSGICAAVDGLPLAIEIAAAMIRSRSARAILEGLRPAPSLLASVMPVWVARHASLGALFDWSWRLLSERERELFSLLSVFRGGFRAESAARVAAAFDIGPEEASSVLDRLVEASLVSASSGPGENYRYRLLATLRDYAGRRLDEAGRSEAARDAHLDCFAAFARDAERGLSRLKARSPLDRIEIELDNLRAALDWGLAAPGRLIGAACIASRLLVFWSVRGGFSEILPRLRAVVARRDEIEASEELGLAYFALADISIIRLSEKLDLYRSAAEELRKSGARESLIRTLVALSIALASRFISGDSAKALEEAEALLEPGDEEALRMRCRLARAQLEINTMRRGEAFLAEAAEAARIFSESGDILYLRVAREALRGYAIGDRDYDVFERLTSLDLESARELGDFGEICECVADLARATASRGDLGKARSLALEAVVLSRDRGLGSSHDRALLVLARIEFELGMVESTRERLQEYIRGNRSEGAFEAAALGESNLAFIDAICGEKKRAEAALREIASREETSGRPWIAASTRLRLGRLEIFLGAEAEAARIFEAVLGTIDPRIPSKESMTWTASCYAALVEAGRGKEREDIADKLSDAIERREVGDLALPTLVRCRLRLARGELERAAILAGAALAMMGFSHLTWMPEMYVAERIVDQLSSERPELAALASEAAKRPFYDIAREELELIRADRSPTTT